MAGKPDKKVSERGDRASFDRRTGDVHGSGSDTGGSGDSTEDYDQDPQAGSGENKTDTGSAEETRP